jgi:hypothetical protein
MPFSPTEQFVIWLQAAVPKTLTLVPGTSQQPWRLLHGDGLLSEIELPAAAADSAVFAAVQAAAVAHGWQVQACGACVHWHVMATESAGSVGACAWPNPDPPPRSSARQSVLAAPCTHFDATAGTAASQPAVPELPSVTVPQSTLPWWQRLWPRRPKQAENSPDHAAGDIVERSGKRPGTIPCLACPGRMANLGAQKCRTHEGDERTFSVWRCRRCLGYYLNDWTDKWVRTDSLEVVDIYYRLAPQEALICLGAIEQTNLKHTTPADLQDWAEAYLAGRTAVRAEVRRAR